MDEKEEITIVVDSDFERKGKSKHFIKAKMPYSKLLYSKTVELLEMTSNDNDPNIHGEFIGLWKVSGKGSAILKNTLSQLVLHEDFEHLTLVELFKEIQKVHPIAVKYIRGSWLDIDSFKKIQKAGDD